MGHEFLSHGLRAGSPAARPRLLPDTTSSPNAAQGATDHSGLPCCQECVGQPLARKRDEERLRQRALDEAADHVEVQEAG